MIGWNEGIGDAPSQIRTMTSLASTSIIVEPRRGLYRLDPDGFGSFATISSGATIAGTKVSASASARFRASRR